MFYVAAVIMPFIAALHRYSVAYGYEGDSREVAYGKAKSVWFAVAGFMVILVALHLT